MDRAAQVVLIVDDQEQVLHAAAAMLRRGGYSVITAADPLKALEEARNFPGNIDLLLTDVLMPAMDGFALAKRISAERPQTRILLITGLTDVQSRLPLLRKPFRMDQLLDKVAKVLDGPPPSDAQLLAEVESGAVYVRDSLAAELTAARRRHLQSAREFLDATRTMEGMPSPDGLTHVQRQGEAMRQAFEDYERARKKLDEHIAGQPETKPKE